VALRCLIVDDNPGFLGAASVLLEHEGIRVVGLASTSDEAIEQAGELHPDVTLLDIDLGGDSGFAVARRLVAVPGLDPGHLIMISAHGADDFADLVEAGPAIGFIGKPVLSAQAIEGLVRAADGHRNDAGHSRGQ
jgi:DNA-binding NarL/FixJ family response regulator